MSNRILGWIGGVLVAALLIWGWVVYSNGADIRMKGNYFTNRYATLEAAIQADDGEAVARAIAGGLDVNVRGIHGITPLMMAVDRLKPQAVTELSAKGADPNLKAEDGAGAVYLAVENYRKAPDIMFAVIKGGAIRTPADQTMIRSSCGL